MKIARRLIGKVNRPPDLDVSTTDRVMATTMSVDEYFDELISQVHEDYAS